ncbi:AbrB/MazE/SpoVT family DNA-binding domain-containing protein [Candidatus Gottesmanbacteria bacterium]|nr:AbrB/MazE/SpoVT family DNA-binding domain-containing protein [Candidatus Gottesmanbacteria bacterium]
MYGTTAVTSKGQNTIPEELRLLLHIQTGDRILYRQADLIKKQYVAEVVSTKNIVEELFGSLNPRGKIKYVPIEIARKEAGKLLGEKYGLTK